MPHPSGDQNSGATTITYTVAARLDTFRGHHYVARDLKGARKSTGKADYRELEMNRPPDNQSRPESARDETRDLASRIASAKRERALANGNAAGSASSDTSGMARGMRMGSEFVAAILVGAVMGYLIDLGLGTTPWAMIILLMVGFAAGVRNVVRTANEMNAASTVGTNEGPADAKRDDKDDA
jgi:ATP synthase protein I